MNISSAKLYQTYMHRDVKRGYDCLIIEVGASVIWEDISWTS